MPEGPYGFPRITNIGPYSELEGTQEYTIEQNDYAVVPEGGLEGSLRKRDIITSKSLDQIDNYVAKLIFRADLQEPPRGNPLARIKHEVSVVTRDNNVATASWMLFEQDAVAVMGTVSVEEEFRRMGIGTEIKERAVEHMQEHGMERAFTLAVSDEGESLARRTRFEETDTAKDINAWDSLNGVVLERRF